MSIYRTTFILCAIAVLTNSLLSPQTSSAQAASDPRTACAADIQRLCSGVAPGGGRIIACLKQNSAQVSNGCKQAILAAMGNPNGPPNPSANPAPAVPNPPPNPSPAPPSPANIAPSTPSSLPANSPSPSVANAHSSATSSTGPGGQYFIMKKVQILDQGLGKGMPAYDLMIPKDWQFKSAINGGTAEGGCFDDFFPVSAQANNADSSIAFTLIPQSTFQYTDDPSGQRQMQVQNQSDVKFGMKACPVRAPMRAEDFLRQDIPKKCPACTLVAAQPFPELAETVRHQLGLPPAAAGANTGNTRVDAARMRVTFTNKQGQASEGWISTAIVVQILPGAGRGASYDWHAVSYSIFATPQGQLDANEKLFKLILSTVRPELNWEKMSNGYISSMYQMRAKQHQLQQQAIGDFQQHAANVINSVTANMVAGANQSHFGADQLVRGVQTFRDPTTGGTYELSNQYNHAWLNGSNEYVMSEDPNFNPNGKLDGSWNQLQVVQPQP